MPIPATVRMVLWLCIMAWWVVVWGSWPVVHAQDCIYLLLLLLAWVGDYKQAQMAQQYKQYYIPYLLTHQKHDPLGVHNPGVHPVVRERAVPAAGPAHPPGLQGPRCACGAGQQADEQPDVGAPGTLHYRRHVLRRTPADREPLQCREGDPQDQGHRPCRHWSETQFPVLPDPANPQEQVHHIHGHLRHDCPQCLPEAALSHL